MAEPTRLRHGRVVPQVEGALRDMLRDGRWEPGERLPNEVMLAAELGVGRSSVREAVRLLARDGLLDVRHGSGTFVTRTGPEQAGADGELDLRHLLRRARLLEVYEVRRALEVEAARLAARRTRPEDVARLAADLKRRQEAAGAGPAAFVDADLEFHRTVVELSGNAVLLGLFTSVLPVLREALVEMVTYETGLPDLSCAHAELLDALARGDAAAAIAATTGHLESVMALVDPVGPVGSVEEAVR
ncbi:FadR/GntR family transcriptional regulator [Streptomyces sp. ME19-01-6]|uniref:FadR/GntR family transcriptional regulator n=1 Tax=Streptomyces sp. ME19-01-6 TaxID=3028686 RepID=UPI0029A0093E|nr:FCD domain-containing protein [Streptomyces sp. ME19-01-6]MDX3231378.1 FCD domain-containing protein [Streptomyces sp. ME19-01-6]